MRQTLKNSRRLALAALLAAAVPHSAVAAMNCAAAKTPAEKAICADPRALAADAGLGEAFAKLRDSLSQDEKAGLLASQRAWLLDRDGGCADVKPMGECLRVASDNRRLLFEGKAESGPGAPFAVTPYFVHAPGGKRATKVAVDALRIADAAAPGAGAFNAAFAAVYADAKVEAGLSKKELAEMPAENHWEFSMNSRLVYASPKLLSAHAEYYSNSGGAHPNSGSSDVNFDVAKGRILKIDDLLDAAGKKKVTDFCFSAVKTEKRDRMKTAGETEEFPTERGDVETATLELGHWSFSADAVTVTYDSYAVGAYAEGAFECKLPYSLLRPLAKPGFPLP